jgi:hypothetical protein
MMNLIITLGVFTGEWMVFLFFMWLFAIRHETKRNKPKANSLRKYLK